ncbi:hypothetical protein GGR92_004939 [Spirosoma lacussanchae]
MVQRQLTYWAFGVSLLVFGGSVYYTLQYPEDSPVQWQNQVMPGQLSLAHASMKDNCASCHTGVKGVDETKCIGCHAADKALLGRQPTAFHANIGKCSACHIEHQGPNADLRTMNHQALAQIGVRLLPELRSRLKLTANADLPTGHPLVSSLEAELNCSGCHSSKDPHFGLFGTDCATCHATTQWTIPAFQHPSVRSTDCAQCHQAPPSHYMGHFEMVSKKVASQGSIQTGGCCEGVQVNQCYVCHQTTAWNDIKGVGFYKHH